MRNVSLDMYVHGSKAVNIITLAVLSSICATSKFTHLLVGDLQSIVGERERVVWSIGLCFFRIRQKIGSHCWCLVHVDRILK